MILQYRATAAFLKGPRVRRHDRDRLYEDLGKHVHGSKARVGSGSDGRVQVRANPTPTRYESVLELRGGVKESLRAAQLDVCFCFTQARDVIRF